MMSQVPPDELSWLLGNKASHHMTLYKRGREGLVRIDCKHISENVQFDFRTAYLSEIYVHPGMFSGDIKRGTEGCLVKSENDELEVIFKEKFLKGISTKSNSGLEYIYFYFKWDENVDIEWVVSHGFICEVDGNEFPLKFSRTIHVNSQKEFNNKRNAISTHDLMKNIHAKQLITLNILSKLVSSGYLPKNEQTEDYMGHSVAYVGTDDGSNFETSLRFLFEQQNNEKFTQLRIRADNTSDNLQLDLIERLYNEFTGSPFDEGHVVQSHLDPWIKKTDDLPFDIIIDTYTIQSWPKTSMTLKDTIAAFKKELIGRIESLNDKGVLVLVYPEPISAFGKIYHPEMENDDEESCRKIFHPKTGYFLKHILEQISDEDDAFSLDVKVYDYDYIGGGIRVRKTVEEVNRYDDVNEDASVPPDQGGWAKESNPAYAEAQRYITEQLAIKLNKLEEALE